MRKSHEQIKREKGSQSQRGQVDWLLSTLRQKMNQYRKIRKEQNYA